MANIQANPWALYPADVVVSSVSSLTLGADGTVTAVTAAAHNISAPPPNSWVTVINPTLSAYVGQYLVLSVTNATTLVLKPNFTIPAGTGAAGAQGNLAKVLYNAMVRIEDISWQNAAAAGQVLDIRDTDGNPIWTATSTGAGQQNRGKVFWVEGLVPFQIPSGVVLVTIN